MAEEYPEQSSTKILQNIDMAVGKLEDRRWGGGDWRKVRKWLKYLSCLEGIYIYV